MLLPQNIPEKFQLGDKYTIFLKQIIGRGANAIVYKGIRYIIQVKSTDPLKQ